MSFNSLHNIRMRAFLKKLEFILEHKLSLIVCGFHYLDSYLAACFLADGQLYNSRASLLFLDIRLLTSPRISSSLTREYFVKKVFFWKKELNFLLLEFCYTEPSWLYSLWPSDYDWTERVDDLLTRSLPSITLKGSCNFHYCNLFLNTLRWLPLFYD